MRRSVACVSMVLGCGGQTSTLSPGETSPDTASVLDAASGVDASDDSRPSDSSAGDSGAILDGCAPIVILESDKAYQSRSETTVSQSGVLTYVPGGGPGDRWLPYRLDGVLLYAGSKESMLEPFVGKTLSLRGKVVDVGYGPELWVGSLEGVCGG
jgi:hypothetical protein